MGYSWHTVSVKLADHYKCVFHYFCLKKCDHVRKVMNKIYHKFVLMLVLEQSNWNGRQNVSLHKGFTPKDKGNYLFHLSCVYNMYAIIVWQSLCIFLVSTLQPWMRSKNIVLAPKRQKWCATEALTLFDILYRIYSLDSTNTIV